MEGMNMLKRVFKNPFFLTGFILLFILFTGSFVYSKFYAESYTFNYFKIYKNGNVAMAPFSPSELFPFGSDRYGKSLLVILIEGAKYTIGVAVGLAFLRMFAGTLLGALFYLLPKKVLKGVADFLDSYHYAPAVIFTFLLLSPAYVAFNWAYDFNELFYYTLFVLAFFSVPVLGLYVANEIKSVYSLEFIQNASLLGGSKLHILWKHVRPFLLPKLSLLFVQQLSQILNMLAHLAILQIFFGGTKLVLTEQENVGEQEGDKIIEAFSTSGEWAGLIGKSWYGFMTYPWLVFFPIVAFTITIFASNLMIEGIKKSTGLERIKLKNRKVKSKKSIPNSYSFKKSVDAKGELQ
jgi:peptide/nickel transport system permease protein